jgi:hypothetical protein
MKITKDEARKSVELYSDLLRNQAIIDQIGLETVRGQEVYYFQTCVTPPTKVYCQDVKTLSTVLSALWDASALTRTALGAELVLD